MSYNLIITLEDIIQNTNILYTSSKCSFTYSDTSLLIGYSSQNEYLRFNLDITVLSEKYTYLIINYLFNTPNALEINIEYISNGQKITSIIGDNHTIYFTNLIDTKMITVTMIERNRIRRTAYYNLSMMQFQLCGIKDSWVDGTTGGATGTTSGATGTTGGATGTTGGATGTTGGATGTTGGATGTTGGATGATGGATGTTGGATGDTGGATGDTGGATGDTGGATGDTGGATGGATGSPDVSININDFITVSGSSSSMNFSNFPISYTNNVPQLSINCSEDIIFSQTSFINESLIYDNCNNGNYDLICLYPDPNKLSIPIQSYIYYSENALIGETERSELNLNMPLGFNIFAEFIINDLTFNVKKNDEDNDDTIYLNLDILYGNKCDEFYFHKNKFIINNSKHDISRNTKGYPIIPDTRNDNNYLIAQMSVLFMKFHNKLIDVYKCNNSIPKNQLFKFVKKQVVFYYQWLIINDFLPRVVDNAIITKYFDNCSFTYDPSIPKYQNKIPKEFIYSVGQLHTYSYPNNFNLALDEVITLEDIYKCVKGKLPKYVIDWSNFFYLGPKDEELNYARKFNARITEEQANMSFIKNSSIPIYKNNVLLKDLMQSSRNNLASAQEYIKEINKINSGEIMPIPKCLLEQYDYDKLLCISNLLDETPLLIYILKESEIYKSGSLLTGLGGKLYAEWIMSTLFNDKDSYLCSAGIWKPILGNHGKFDMADLIRFIYC